MLCCGRRKEQGRDIPPHQEPAQSPRRLQLGQFGTALPPGRAQAHLPPMVLQPDFRKVSGISTEIFRQLESVENDHDATTAAALGAVERRGEMLVRLLDPRQFSRQVQDSVRKFLSMQDGLHSVHFVEIVKRPGQTLGLYIREGNGIDRYDGVFVSRIAMESAVFNSGCLGVGDEILAVNLVDVTHMSLDDVVILMSIPRRLVLTIRQRKGRMTSSASMMRSESKMPPVVVIKKELEENGESNGNGNGELFAQMGTRYGRQQQRGMMGGGQYGVSPYGVIGGRGGQQGGSPYYANLGIMGMGGSGSAYSLSRQYGHQQPHYANLPLGGAAPLPDVAEYASVGRRGEYPGEFRLEAPTPPIRRSQYSQDFDPYRPPDLGSHMPRPPSQQSITGTPGLYSQEWGYSRPPGPTHTQHTHGHGHSHPGMSYQPPPPVITEQPRAAAAPSHSHSQQHFQPFDRQYPKTLESLAEKVHTFYTGPRPQKYMNGGGGRGRMPRAGSDHRLSLGRGGAEPPWYGPGGTGSMPRRAVQGATTTGEFRPSRYGPGPGVPGSGAGLGGRVSALQTRRSKTPLLDYASDSEAMTTSYPSGIRGALPAATRRSLGLANGIGSATARSNSLPRDLIRGRGGRKAASLRMASERGRAGHDLSRKALLLAAGLDSQDESDGALSAPEMPLTPRRERAEYRAWLTRAPSTSAIYERLKTNRDFDLIQTQKAAKLTYSAENLTLLDRAKARTERQLKLLTESMERENLNNLAQWEAQQRIQQEQARPYYSYRTHLSGGDSTLARALASTTTTTPSAALRDLGIREPPAGAPSADLRSRVALSTSRSRDLLSDLRLSSASPSAALLSRISQEKDESLLRKEILGRSLIEPTAGGVGGVPAIASPPPLDGTDKSEKIAQRLHPLLTGRAPPPTAPPPTGKLLTINPSEFSRYKIERVGGSQTNDLSPSASPIHPEKGHSGILRVHLLAGRALRSTVKSTDASARTRDLYCVLECDRVHKARTVVCTGDQNFDWDEVFDLDLVANKELDFLIYSWDPQLRHRLCYKGSVNLLQVLGKRGGDLGGDGLQLAIKVEPRGTLYVKLRHSPPEIAFRRALLPTSALFGADLTTVVAREESGLNVPLIVQRCIEEVERRGLDIIGLYRLCGSATKKIALREAFERSPRTVDLSAENVPDINVITGVLKDYLRELPEPLLTKSLYAMLLDALSVCLPDDPEGNARLLFSIIECLPKPNRCTLLLILEHLSLVCSLSDRNKMGPVQVAASFGPILMVQADHTPESLDFAAPIKVLQYLLETWPAKSVRAAGQGVEAVRKGTSSGHPRHSQPGSQSPQPFIPRSKLLRSSLKPKAQPPLPTSSTISSSPSTTTPSSLLLHRQPNSPLDSAPSTPPTIPRGGGGFLPPSTTSSSLLTITTSSYSITSEFSTTSVVSPPTSSTRESLVQALQEPTSYQQQQQGEGYASEKGRGEGQDHTSMFQTMGSVRSRASVFENGHGHGYGTGQEHERERPVNGGGVPPSPFLGRKTTPPMNILNFPPEKPVPGRVERQGSDSFEENPPSSSTTSSNASISSKRRLPSLPPSQQQQQQQQGKRPESFEEDEEESVMEMVELSGGRRDSFQEKREREQEREREELEYQQQFQYHQYEQQEEEQGRGQAPPPAKKPVPPPPPPKPSGSRQRFTSASSSASEDSAGEGEESSNGGEGREKRAWSNGGGGRERSGSASSASGSTTTTPTTVKGASPLGTPPPVPPRLDRRPSQPSPTSSPPAIPPPVPPRLGRAAVVRTPSLDGREAFEVDCYTIKEENGEEDFLT